MVGMTVDTILAFEVVLPTGVVKTVTAADKDLFWALKVRTDSPALARPYY